MYAAPPSIEAEVFTKIPEKFSQGNRASEWATVQIHGAPSPTFLEGPVFDNDGFLWVTDIPWGRLFKIDPQGNVEVGAEYDGYPNGIKFLKDGRGVIACHKRGMMQFDPKTGEVTPLVERHMMEPFKGCNDLCVASNGDIYFTDQGQSGLHLPNGRLYRLTPEGQLHVVLDHIPSPNGLALNKAETFIFLAVTRDNAIWRVPLTPHGSVTKVGKFIQMSGGNGPDGVAIDAEDNLAICHVGIGSVWLFSNLGEPLLRIRAPEGTGRMTTNCAYGGPDNKTLFITESTSGTILKAQMPVAGRLLPSQVR